jgi:hypothetical protein
MRQHTSAYVSIGIRQHTSRQYTSAYAASSRGYAVLPVVAREEEDLADEGREHSGAAAQEQHVACLM